MAFVKGFRKVADAPDSPRIDPRKAAAMQRGASMGTDWGAGWANLKSELGFGRAAPPPPAPKNVGKMGG